MMAIFFIGTGVSTAAVGLAPNFVMLSIALFAVGLFAAIYHPVGIPMVIDQAVHRGRTMSLNGVFGNVGVSVAAVFTAALTSWIGWRWAFFIPAAIFILTGVAYLMLMPDDRTQRKAAVSAQDVKLDRRVMISVIALFMLMALTAGVVFNALTITLPKLVDARVGDGLPLVLVGFVATAVFLCGAVAQLAIGRLVDRVAPHILMSIVGLLQFVGTVFIYLTTGIPMLFALALSVAATYAQVTVNDIVLARYTPAAWRGRIYALRFFLVFTFAGPAVWVIGRLYDIGGFDLVLWLTAILAAGYAINSFAITGLVASAERKGRDDVPPPIPSI